ncbi:diguanylate cyclase (GGDEF) domain-containing protein [Lachnospiraceae bacterium C7]|nr:diguanylate cyclase (GGDEF) domain-containing protein [Lachnospiraceae bacterium C7]
MSKKKNKDVEKNISKDEKLFCGINDNKRDTGIGQRLPFIMAFITIIVMICVVIYASRVVVEDKYSDFENKKDYSDKKVLYLSSYDISHFTVLDQYAGLEGVFDEYGIDLDSEFMNTKKITGDEHEDLFKQVVKEKVSNIGKYDAVIVGDDAALQFTMDNYNEIFPNTLIVFLGINTEQRAIEAIKNENFTGSVEKFYIKDTINMAIKFQPTAKNIVAIYDNSLTGEEAKEQFFKLKDKYKNYKFTGINASTLTPKNFENELEKLNVKNDIVLYLNVEENASGEHYSLDHATKIVVDACKNAPVYRTTPGGEGKGVIGGKSIDFQMAGNDAAEKVIEYFEKGKIKNTIEETSDIGMAWVDYRLLNKFGFDYNNSPSDCRVINYTYTYYDMHKKDVITIEIVMGCIFIGFVFIGIDNAKKYSMSRRLESQYMILQEKEKQIKHLADHDALTDLLNRRSMEDDLRKIISNHGICTIMHIDVDDFKGINDNYGHACGDEVLKVIGERFKALGKLYGIKAYRIGGDEFLIIIKDKFLQRTSEIMNAIVDVSVTPILFKSKQHYITLSIGLSYFDGKEDTITNVITKADLAMYQAKRHGKNNMVIYSSALKDSVDKKMKIKQVLKKAYDDKAFYMLYQPQFSPLDGKVKSFEALVRLENGEFGPGEFIPVMEESDLILKIGRLTTELVIKQISDSMKAGYKVVPVSVNYSVKQLNDATYVGFLEQTLKKYNVPPNMLEIEITESILVKNKKLAKSIFYQMDQLGVQLVLDDFGSGYSSLNYLKYIPAKKVKLDKSLIDGYLEEDNIFIENIINLVHSLNLKVTVEGVEEKWQLDKLKSYGSDLIQGFYYSKPIYSDDAVKYLEKY